MSQLMRPIVIWGPSGAGKSTLLKRLIQEHEDHLGFTVSHTTRKPRVNEVDGKDYHFTDRKEMENAIETGGFIEYAEFSGNLYGTSKKALEKVQQDGKICVLDLDLQGIINVKKLNLNPLFIYIKPPNLEVLEQRLRNRGTESDENIAKRLDRARKELSIKGIEKIFDLTIVNDDIDEAYAALNYTVQNVLQGKSCQISCVCSEDGKSCNDIFLSRKVPKKKLTSLLIDSLLES